MIQIHCEHRVGHKCSAGHFGGTPSVGVCGHCVFNSSHVKPGINPHDYGKTQESHLSRKWRLLHAFAQSLKDPIDVAAVSKWLTDWETGTKTEPGINCPSCSMEWKKVKTARPPVFTSAKDFYRWTVDVHNDVNLLLHKPIWMPPA